MPAEFRALPFRDAVDSSEEVATPTEPAPPFSSSDAATSSSASPGGVVPCLRKRGLPLLRRTVAGATTFLDEALDEVGGALEFPEIRFCGFVSE